MPFKLSVVPKSGGGWAWVRWGKIKCAANYVGLCGWLQLFLFCEVLAFCLSFYCLFSVVVSSFRGTANVRRLGEGGDFTTEISYEAHTSNLRKTVIRSTEPPLLPNRCYQLPFCLSEVLSLLNIH